MTKRIQHRKNNAEPPKNRKLELRKFKEKSGTDVPPDLKETDKPDQDTSKRNKPQHYSDPTSYWAQGESNTPDVPPDMSPRQRYSYPTSYCAQGESNTPDVPPDMSPRLDHGDDE